MTPTSKKSSNLSHQREETCSDPRIYSMMTLLWGKELSGTLLLSIPLIGKKFYLQRLTIFRHASDDSQNLEIKKFESEMVMKAGQLQQDLVRKVCKSPLPQTGLTRSTISPFQKSEGTLSEEETKKKDVEYLVRQFLESNLESKDSQFAEILEKLNFENKKLKEKHISQKNQQKVLVRNAEELIQRVEIMQKQLEVLKEVARAVTNSEQDSEKIVATSGFNYNSSDGFLSALYGENSADGAMECEQSRPIKKNKNELGYSYHGNNKYFRVDLGKQSRRKSMLNDEEYTLD